jgi:O-antigen ligase
VVPSRALRQSPSRAAAPHSAALPASPSAAAIPAPSRLLRIIFVLFVFSVPFESLDALSTGHTFSLSRLLGLLLIAAAVSQMGASFRRPPVSFWLFGIYLLIALTIGLTEPSGYWSGALAALETLLQLLVLFWIASNLLRHPPVARSTLAAFALSTFLVAVLSLVGIGITVIPGTGRVSMFGEDPNTVAGMLSVGILAWIALGPERTVAGSRLGRFWMIGCAVVGVAVIRTGSRGGLVALLAGILTVSLAKRGRRPRGRNVAMVLAIVAALVAGVLASGTNVRRWTEAFETRSAAGREQIFPAAWTMFLERPVAGWGPGRNLEELGARLNYSSIETGPSARDTHNGLLWILTETGLVGFIPFVAALWLCLRAAWRARARAYGVMPFALVICILIVNMSITWQKRKFFWLVLAFGVAGARALVRRRSAPAGKPRPGFREIVTALPTV